ncbi:MAG: DUF1997 domain-containing protein [Cyanobacteria bacterium J06641_5]
MEASSLKSSVVNLDSLAEPATAPAEIAAEPRAFVFQHPCSGTMELKGDLAAAADYFNAHQGWFCRCARPMQADPLGDYGYVLTIGQYGAFGYEVEPKMGVELLPGVDGCYRMHSVPLPEDELAGYRVAYEAMMQLVPAGANATHVEWNMDLQVTIEFPGFIRRLPRRVIQNTGDRLLARIVRQVSRRLTEKVRADFHSSQELS